MDLIDVHAMLQDIVESPDQFGFKDATHAYWDACQGRCTDKIDDYVWWDKAHLTGGKWWSLSIKESASNIGFRCSSCHCKRYPPIWIAGTGCLVKIPIWSWRIDCIRRPFPFAEIFSTIQHRCCREGCPGGSRQQDCGNFNVQPGRLVWRDWQRGQHLIWTHLLCVDDHCAVLHCVCMVYSTQIPQEQPLCIVQSSEKLK